MTAWRPRPTALLAGIAALAICACSATPSSVPPSTAIASGPPPASSAPVPTPGGPSVRLDLGGEGPLGIVAVGTTAWVALEASGELVEVALDGPAPVVARRLTLDPGGAYLDALAEAVLVGRYQDSTGRGVLVVDPAEGTLRGPVDTGSVAAVALDPDTPRRAWVLGAGGEVLVIDVASRSVVGRSSITVHELEHLNGVAAAGSFWASSDTTAVRRLEPGSGNEAPPAVAAEIETGGGIPLVVADGLVWGARADELWAIDPATNRIVRGIALKGLIEILDLDIADGQAWIAARAPGRLGTVVVADLESGDQATAGPASLPAGVAIAGDRAWVTDYNTGELLGFDPPIP